MIFNILLKLSNYNLLILEADVCGIRIEPYWKFVWNENMLKKVYSEIQSDWILVIVHGFIGQSSIL